MLYNDPMKINVHMSAYGLKSDIRVVDVPDVEITPKTTIQEALELAFKYGQNDFQPLKHPSVSVGDVVELKGKYYMVMSAGYEELTEGQFKNVPDQVAMKPKYLRKLMGV